MKFPDVIAELWKLHYRLTSVENDVNYIFEQFRLLTKDMDLPVPPSPLDRPHETIPDQEVTDGGAKRAKARAARRVPDQQEALPGMGNVQRKRPAHRGSID